MTAAQLQRPFTCFFERDPDAALAPRLAAEGVGTLLLVLSVAQTGLVTQRLGHGDALLAMIVSALIIPATLVSLILAFGAASGGHFNPLITVLQWLAGERRPGCTVAYVAIQLLGGLAGAGLASLTAGTMLPHVAPAASLRVIGAEAVATAGLMAVVLGCARSGRTETGPFAVGAWLSAAIVLSPSGSYANPALSLAAILPIGPVHLPGITALGYVAGEGAGALLAFAIIRLVYPRLCAGGGLLR